MTSDHERGNRLEQARWLLTRQREDGSLVHELLSNQTMPFEVAVAGDTVVEIEVPDAPVIEIRDGKEFPQLDSPIVLVQPEVVRQDWRCGWCPIGGSHFDSELELAEPDSGLVWPKLDGNVCVWGSEGCLEIERTGTFPLYIVVRERASQ